MKARVLALAAILSAIAGGGLYFVNWNNGSFAQDSIVGGFGMLEVVDRSQCDVSACAGNNVCLTAQNFLNDAGSPCQAGFINCDIRVGQTLRSLAADAGVALGAQGYQRVRIGGMRCPVDGGQGVAFAYGIPVDDNGWPIFMFTTTAPKCVRAPLDGGTDCLKQGISGVDATPTAPYFFGTGNVFSASLASGTQCEPVECTVIAGDNPDTSL